MQASRELITFQRDTTGCNGSNNCSIIFVMFVDGNKLLILIKSKFVEVFGLKSREKVRRLTSL